MYADQRRLLQVLSNLLGNAMKFTPTGGRVVLSARRGNGSGAGWLQVRDTGPGITPEDQSTSSTGSGTRSAPARRLGLGLAIAAGLVRAHGGQLRVESDGHRGSRFCFTVPCSGGMPPVGDM